VENGPEVNRRCKRGGTTATGFPRGRFRPVGLARPAPCRPLPKLQVTHFSLRLKPPRSSTSVCGRPQVLFFPPSSRHIAAF
jgi:hypothetical protein